MYRPGYCSPTEKLGHGGAEKKKKRRVRKESRMHFHIALLRLQDEGKAEWCNSKQPHSNRGWGLRAVSGPCPPLSLPTFAQLPRGRDSKRESGAGKTHITKLFLPMQIRNNAGGIRTQQNELCFKVTVTGTVDYVSHLV